MKIAYLKDNKNKEKLNYLVSIGFNFYFVAWTIFLVKMFYLIRARYIMVNIYFCHAMEESYFKSSTMVNIVIIYYLVT